MNIKGLEYGKWLSKYSWNLFVTIRRRFTLTEFNIRSMIKRFQRRGVFKRLFYVIEGDRQDNMSHVHLIIETSFSYNSKGLARAFGVEVSEIRHIGKVKDSHAVSNYCTKYISVKALYYDFIEYNQETESLI